MAALNRGCQLLAVGQFSTVYAAGLYARFSARAADGDLADHFRYGFVTGHRPVYPANGSFLIFSAAGAAIDS